MQARTEVQKAFMDTLEMTRNKVSNLFKIQDFSLKTSKGFMS